jgi:hypothetical protein
LDPGYPGKLQSVDRTDPDVAIGGMYRFPAFCANDLQSAALS